MAINLVTKYQPYVDEIFTKESKKSLLTNQDYDWTGAHTIKVYKITTSEMQDYKRNPVAGFTGSRYGEIKDLDATTEEMTLKKDRSFTFVIDKLDNEETAGQLAAASALARQQRQVVIPEVDTYTYGVMATGAGTKPAAVTLTDENIYTEILKAGTALDNADVPEDNRQLVVTPDVYQLMKRCKDIVMETNIAKDQRRNCEPGRGERDQGTSGKASEKLWVYAGSSSCYGCTYQVGGLQDPPGSAGYFWFSGRGPYLL